MGFQLPQASVRLAGLFIFGLQAFNASACSCASYYDERPAPSWVYAQEASADGWQASGGSMCTGIKRIDERRADTDARSSLSKLLGTKVQTSEISKLSSSNQASSSRFQSVSLQQSQQLLKNATVFDRWVDAENCQVYAGIRVSVADIEAAKIAEEADRDSKLLAKNSCVIAKGANPKLSSKKLTALLIQQGFVINSEQKCQIKYRINTELVGVGKDFVKSQTQVMVNHGPALLWQKTYPGKGVSFNQRSQSELANSALQDSLSQFKQDLDPIKNIKVDDK
ncbi:hypothetical protein [Shewanella sp.]|uniref:hypothetical protein n=1 Tax=Shewanella sp. TaxID=50422 RepID=UPI0040537F66